MSKLLINEHPLLILPTLAVAIGLNEAIILQQVHYWLDSRTNNNFREGKYWTYNTYSQWRDQFPFLSEVTIRRSIKSLEIQELLISKNFNSSSFNKVKWYTIDYEKLAELENSLNNKNPAKAREFNDSTKRSDRCDQIDQIGRSNRSEDEIKKIASNIEETKTTTENTTYILEKRSSFNKTGKNKEPFNIAIQMIKIWNEKVEEGNEVELSNHISRKLLICYDKFLDKNLEKWHEFCQTIANNNFLNGEAGSFKATLLWSLERKNTIKILEGYYRSDNKKHTQPNQEVSVDSLKQEISNLNTPEFWKKTKECLLEDMGKDTYTSWLKNLSFVKLEEGVLELNAPTRFIAQQIEQQFELRIKKISNRFNDEIKKVKIRY